MEAAKKNTENFSISAYDGTLDVDSKHLSHNANEILTGASQLCEQLKHTKVEPCHVAYQLYAADDSGLGAYILERGKIDVANVTEFLQKAVGGIASGAYAFDGRSVTFSQPFVDLLKRARNEQRGIGDKLLGVDHIAIAICGCTDPHLKGIEELGVVLSAVRPAVSTLKVGALRAEAEEEKRRRVAAEAVAHRESERAHELVNQLSETQHEMQRLQSNESTDAPSSATGDLASSDDGMCGPEMITRTSSMATSNSELYDDY